MNKYKSQTTNIPGSDLPAAHYLNLVANAFLAHLAGEFQKGLPADPLHIPNLLEEYAEVLNFLTENLESNEPLHFQ